MEGTKERWITLPSAINYEISSEGNLRKVSGFQYMSAEVRESGVFYPRLCSDGKYQIKNDRGDVEYLKPSFIRELFKREGKRSSEFTKLDEDDICTYPAIGRWILVKLKDGITLWHTFYGERRTDGFYVTSDLYGQRFKFEQIDSWKYVQMEKKYMDRHLMRRIRG